MSGHTAIQQVDIFSAIENQVSQGKITKVETKADNMQIPTIKQMKTTVVEKLLQALNARESYMVLTAQLYSLDVRESFPSLYIREVVTPVVRSYFSEICNRLTNAHACDTPAEISLGIEYSDFDSRQERDFIDSDVDVSKRVAISKQLATGDSKSETEIEELIVAIVESIPFESIYNSLETQVVELVPLGLKIIARTLVDKLNIGANFTPPKQKGRHVICQTYPSNYWKRHEKEREMQKLNQALKTVENKSDVCFGDAVFSLCDAIRDTTYEQQTIPSRTSFCKGETLEIHCFKDKYELRFTKKSFEAISAFIYCYGSDRDINSLDEILNNQKAA